MGRQQLDGDSIRDESIEGKDIKDGSILLNDLNIEVLDSIGDGGLANYNIDGGKSCTNYGGTNPIHGGNAGC